MRCNSCSVMLPVGTKVTTLVFDPRDSSSGKMFEWTMELEQPLEIEVNQFDARVLSSRELSSDEREAWQEEEEERQGLHK